MSISANKEISRRFIEELWNRRKLSLADELVDKNCITHQLRSGGDTPGVLRGSEEMKSRVKEWTTAFPDLRFMIEHMIAEGDRVMMQIIALGTHKGSWQGIPPTGKEVTIRVSVIQRIKDKRIVEDWVLVDFLGVFQQLGVLLPTKDLFDEASRIARPSEPGG